MIAYPGMRAAILILAASLIGVGVCVPCLAQETATAPADTTGRTGALVFLDSWNQTVMPITVAQLRVTAERRTEASLLIAGHQVARTEDLVQLAWQHRVRSNHTISRAYLADLERELGVTQLVLVQLIIEPARLVILARSLDTDSGIVQRVWIREEPIDPILSGDAPEFETIGLQWALTAGLAAMSELEELPAVPVAPRVVMLPVAPVGCGALESVMATHALLEGLVRAADVAVLDPAVVVGALHDGGYDPDRLDATARRYLGDAFGVAMIARPELLAYGSGNPVRRRSIIDEPGQPLQPRSQVQSFSLIMRQVDLTDGATILGGDVYLQHQGRIGWFGNVDDASLLFRLQQASESLWKEFRAHLDET